MKISSAACGFSPIKIHFSDYPISLFSRINEVYVFYFSIKYRNSHLFSAITLVIVLAWFL